MAVCTAIKKKSSVSLAPVKALVGHFNTVNACQFLDVALIKREKKKKKKNIYIYIYIYYLSCLPCLFLDSLFCTKLVE